MSNLLLPDGHNATLRDRLTYAQARSIRVAMLAADEDRKLLADLDLILLKAYVSGWDLDVALDAPETAPDDVVQAIQERALELWSGEQGVPKAGNGISPSQPPEQLSEALTRISATSSSSPTTPAGPGTT